MYELKDEEQFTVIKEDDMYIVSGRVIDRILGRVNMADNESLYYFQKCLDELGVNKALKEAGVQEGDTVKVVDWELEWYD